MRRIALRRRLRRRQRQYSNLLNIAAPHMKTPTMPDDNAISVRPARTQGIPLAPSAARLERLRRPIAIIAPQPTSPNTPATRAPHFHQASNVLTVPDRPGGACGAGLGTPLASQAPCWT